MTISIVNVELSPIFDQTPGQKLHPPVSLTRKSVVPNA